MTVLAGLRERSHDMREALAALVEVESPSTDRRGTTRCGDVLSELTERLTGGRPERIEVDGRVHLRWRFGEPRILLLGHLDTVWPLGTLARWPLEVDGDLLTGPGVFDMKAGLVQGLYALSVLDDLDGVTILVTSDEELGSPSSRVLIEETASGLDATLVLEPSADGALKTGRKGVSMYRVAVHGRASHAGLDPEKGANALVELSHQVQAVAALADPSEATTVTPTVAAAGAATNVVPAHAWVDVDVRVATVAEQERVDRAMRRLAGVVPGTSLEVTGGPNRPPLEPSAADALFARARKLAADLGLAELGCVQVGGASDGNFTAGLGVPTLDGLGAVGDGAHAEGEHIRVSGMPERAALVAALVEDLRSSPATRAEHTGGIHP
jgi:glutamate carboxypeptidase